MLTLFSLYHRRLVVLTAALSTLISLSAQAALPDTVQTALTKAGLTPNNISILITPVGNKTASRLPPIVLVTDSKNSAGDNSSKDINSTNNLSNKTALPFVTIDKQTIKQQERALNGYTDDPYTHQSLESTPDLLINSYPTKTAANLHVSTPTNTVKPPLFSHNPTIARTPASTMKLIPTFIALDTLGADFVWFTRVYHSGVIIGNQLYGDLIIQGSGDPKMTHKRLEQLLYQVQKTGIRHIEGDIIIDSTVFNNVSKDPVAFDHAPLRPYNASPDGFLVNFNSMAITSHLPNNGQAELTYAPQLANYQLPKLIDTRASACSNARYSLAPQWQVDKLTLNTKLPVSCAEHIFYVGYPDAKDFAARIVAAKWQALGNTLAGKVIAHEKPYASYSANNFYSMYKYSMHKTDRYNRPNVGIFSQAVSALPIVSYPSFNLTQQIYDINHFSNNVMTEQVALSIGSYSKAFVIKANTAPNNVSTTSLYQFDKPKTSDYPQALEIINQWWQTNLHTPPPYLTNGSGLCRDCTVTAANLSELLSFAYDHPSFRAYVASLGVAGVSGTIAHHSKRLPTSAAIGRAWIKTGTLNNVTAMAGYVKGQSGQDYTVVGLINTEQAINSDNARAVLDAMLDWTAQQ